MIAPFNGSLPAIKAVPAPNAPPFNAPIPAACATSAALAKNSGAANGITAVAAIPATVFQPPGTLSLTALSK